jgi:hypothetical protein
METNKLEVSNDRSSDFTNIKALISKKSGKSDMLGKVYNKPIMVTLNSLGILKKEIEERLLQNQIESMIYEIEVTIEKGANYTFGSWDDFLSHRWDFESKTIKSLRLNWDFVIKFPNFDIPQRHSLTVKISSEANPSDVFRAIIQGSLDDSENFEVSTSLILCTVDFINDTLAEDLLDRIEKWIEICDKHDNIGKFRSFLFKNKLLFAHLSEITICFLCSSIVFIAYSLLRQQIIISVNTVIIAVFITLPTIKAINMWAHSFGSVIYNKCSQQMQFRVFNITSGDKRESSKECSKKDFKREFFCFVCSNLLAIMLFVLGIILNSAISKK